MIPYVIESSLCLGIFYLIYSLWLRKETFFQLNRWYLLLTLAVSLLIPLLEWSPVLNTSEALPSAVYLEPITVSVQQLENTIEEIVITPTNITSGFTSILLWIYWLGVGFFALRFLAGLFQIGKLLRSGTVESFANYRVVHTNRVHLPFSFFNYLFWSTEVQFSASDKAKIMRHELSHIRQGHSFDVLLSEMACIFLWCNPFVFLQKNALRNIHEYLADAAVLQDTPTRHYGQLLLRQFQSGWNIALANNFIHSQLKKRIIMMTKNKSRQAALLKYAILFPVSLLLLTVFSQKNALANYKIEDTSEISISDFDKEAVRKKLIAIISNYHLKSTAEHQELVYQQSADVVAVLIEQYPDHEETIAKITTAIVGDLKVPFKMVKKGGQSTLVHLIPSGKGTYKVVEEMPRFPGCEDVSDTEQRKNCAQKKMLMHIYQNIKYPKAAREAGIQGTVVFGFTVKADGQLSNFTIIEGIGGGCDEEVLRIARTMPDWIPGKQDGKHVAVEYVLPVKFKLDTSEDRADAKSIKHPKRNYEVFKVVEEMPRFPGCESETDAQVRKKCATKKMLHFIYQNLSYPEEAKEQGIEGTVVVNFVVDESGSLIDPKIVRSIGGGTDEVVLELIELMNNMPEKWIPGKQRGKTVKVAFNLPLKFRLESKTRKEEPKPVTVIGRAATENQAPTINNTLEVKRFNVFPNPAISKISMDIELDTAPFTLQVADVNGQVIYKKEIADGRINITDLDISKVAAGTLYITVQQDGKTTTKTIVVQ